LIVADSVHHAGSIPSDAELARLSGWPDEIADDDLVTYFTLTSDDLGWLASTVRAENRLGAAVQLCTLPWLGWIPDELSACPAAAIRRRAATRRRRRGGAAVGVRRVGRPDPTRSPSAGARPARLARFGGR
jgi:hypothetical protein